jgi:hypothetical protein
MGQSPLREDQDRKSAAIYDYQLILSFWDARGGVETDTKEVGDVTPLFQHGDLVVRRNRRDERGTVRGAALRLAGRNFYRVVFPSSPNPVQVPEGDLEKVTFEMSIEERLLNGEFGDQSTFSRLAYVRAPPISPSGYPLFATCQPDGVPGIPVQAAFEVSPILQTEIVACR